MNHLKKKRGLMTRATSCVIACAVIAIGVWAQDTSVTTVQHGPSSFDTQVRDAEIVYVEGNDLVLKLENGRVEHLVVPDSDKFHVDGRELTVRDLKPGTKITETITTTRSPRYVNTVRTIEGKVWHVSAPTTVILSLGDGTQKQYTVPDHAKFTIDGESGKTIFDLKKGMRVQATVVTDSAHDVVEQSKTVTGQAPPTPETPQQVGTLLIITADNPLR
jgi:RNase P/RNase MRP subunit p29